MRNKKTKVEEEEGEEGGKIMMDVEENDIPDTKSILKASTDTNTGTDTGTDT
eukprot:CAMPEP_0184857286 /NCGR_PEP_ID=MMETSP0580-20130426/2451_1 /TAXON_ID=1118495 /ORGANISM="Dactyliosolen fragilissimus" /LENGTH=51 /DNA_ID=CAMNT_0027352799 /DNA_START=27 /DNA_END=178 /DNA_ORIENTATION=+